MLTVLLQAATESNPLSKMRGAIGAMSRELALESGQPRAPAMHWLMRSSG